MATVEYGTREIKGLGLPTITVTCGCGLKLRITYEAGANPYRLAVKAAETWGAPSPKLLEEATCLACQAHARGEHESGFTLGEPETEGLASKAIAAAYQTHEARVSLWQHQKTVCRRCNAP